MILFCTVVVSETELHTSTHTLPRKRSTHPHTHRPDRALHTLPRQSSTHPHRQRRRCPLLLTSDYLGKVVWRLSLKKSVSSYKSGFNQDWFPPVAALVVNSCLVGNWVQSSLLSVVLAWLRLHLVVASNKVKTEALRWQRTSRWKHDCSYCEIII